MRSLIRQIAAEQALAVEATRRCRVRREAEIDPAVVAAAGGKPIEGRQRCVLGVDEEGVDDAEPVGERGYGGVVRESPLQQHRSRWNIARPNDAIVVEINTAGKDRRAAVPENPTRGSAAGEGAGHEAERALHAGPLCAIVQRGADRNHGVDLDAIAHEHTRRKAIVRDCPRRWGAHLQVQGLRSDRWSEREREPQSRDDCARLAVFHRTQTPPPNPGIVRREAAAEHSSRPGHSGSLIVVEFRETQTARTWKPATDWMVFRFLYGRTRLSTTKTA